MGKITGISWCHCTWSPWHGCQKVSAGCFRCYAETQSRRYGYSIWGPPEHTSRRHFGEGHWRDPILWDRQAAKAGERWRVFPSMCDPFELHPEVTDERARMFDLIRATPNLDWLLLTKRPQNIAYTMPPGYWDNVWLGTSTEDQENAELRIPDLIQHRDSVPVLFLSIEPQLGPVCAEPWLEYLDWGITGGESGAGHRPFDLDWARHSRDEFAEAGVAWHYKQFGGRTHAEGGCLIDGEEIKQFPTPRERVAA